jgi:hypothetical protein
MGLLAGAAVAGVGGVGGAMHAVPRILAAAYDEHKI